MNHGGHVFLVDDNQDIRFHMVEVLRHHGYSVSDFDSAPAFLRSAQRMSPAVLVLDMRMPVMNGLDLQHTLHQQSWHLPIVFISGESQNQEIIDAMKSGAIDFLWKPFTHIQLLQAIDKGLAIATQRQSESLRFEKVQALFETLSRTEKRVFSLILLGHGNKDIAALTGVMADTVKKHRAQVLTKMQVANLADLLALCKNYVPPSDPASST